MHFIATLLHPQFKKFGDNNLSQQFAINQLHAMIQQRALLPVHPSSTYSFITNTTTTTRHYTPLGHMNRITTSRVLERCIDKPSKPSASNTEVDEWIRSSLTLGDDDDILQFWNRNSRVFPVLANIAREVLAIPASNTSVERLFSSAKNTVDDHRTRLSIEKIDRLLFLQRNEPAFKKMESSTDSDFDNSQGSKRKVMDYPDKENDATSKKKKDEEPNIFDELFAILEEENDDRCDLLLPQSH